MSYGACGAQFSSRIALLVCFIVLVFLYFSYVTKVNPDDSVALVIDIVMRLYNLFNYFFMRFCFPLAVRNLPQVIHLALQYE